MLHFIFCFPDSFSQCWHWEGVYDLRSGGSLLLEGCLRENSLGISTFSSWKRNTGGVHHSSVSEKHYSPEKGLKFFWNSAKQSLCWRKDKTNVCRVLEKWTGITVFPYNPSKPRSKSASRCLLRLDLDFFKASWLIGGVLWHCHLIRHQHSNTILETNLLLCVLCQFS